VCHLSFTVQNELGEVPWNHVSLTSLAVVQLAMVSQKHEQWVGALAVYLDLLEDWELSVEILVNEFTDLLGRTVLLTEKLVAGEGQNLEALGTKLLMHIDHSLVVGRCQPSLACYIHNHDCLAILES